jgi:hypothetical protein
MTTPSDIVVVATVSTLLEAEIMRGLLEANRIPAWLSSESAGAAIGISIGPLSEVEVFVSSEYEFEAKQLLDELESGDLQSD